MSILNKFCRELFGFLSGADSSPLSKKEKACQKKGLLFIIGGVGFSRGGKNCFDYSFILLRKVSIVEKFFQLKENKHDRGQGSRRRFNNLLRDGLHHRGQPDALKPVRHGVGRSLSGDYHRLGYRYPDYGPGGQTSPTRWRPAWDSTPFLSTPFVQPWALPGSRRCRWCSSAAC